MNTSGIRVDTVPPRPVSVVPPPAGTYAVGDLLSFKVKFSEPVFVVGMPTVGLSIAGATRQAAYVSGAGESTLVFQYRLTAADVSRQRLVLATAITLPGGSTIRDAAGAMAITRIRPPRLSGIVVTRPTATPLA